jgi:hypothetical protein
MKGQSDSDRTNKTEFMRYLDENPTAVKALAPRLKEYHVNFARGTKFGGWMRQKYLAHFARVYQAWWLKHPELFDKVYQQQNQLSV